ncbi:MAG TPA: hypothetical protein VD704_10740 [Gaiellaceae bacterium]|nr:hypothetical protein [Gaiellaceae bacterium]
MRRVALLLAVAAAAVGASGCAGAEGRKAQELLEESEQAFAAVQTYRLGGRMTMSTPFGDFGLELTAAVDQREDAFVMRMRSADFPEVGTVVAVARGDRFWMKVGEGWEAIPAPAAGTTAADGLDILPYIEDVDVDEGRTVGAEPAVKITGVIDSGGFMEGFLAGMPSGFPTDSFDLGDMRAVVYLSERTHLPLRLLVDQSMEVDGERFEIRIDLAVTNVDEPVEVPSPAG